MLEKLLSSFGEGAIHKAAMIINISSQLVKTFEQEFKEDKNAKNAAIDALVELLNQHKDSAE